MSILPGEDWLIIRLRVDKYRILTASSEINCKFNDSANRIDCRDGQVSVAFIEPATDKAIEQAV